MVLPAWKASLGFGIYFIPDFDDTNGYYSAASAVRTILEHPREFADMFSSGGVTGVG